MGRVTFGPFDFDTDQGHLHRSGAEVRLQPQPAKILTLLVERAGELVTRDEIRRTLWPSDTFVDFDQSVNFCIRQIRTALRDNADTPCYIETLPRRGYRFIAPLQKDRETVEQARRTANAAVVLRPMGGPSTWRPLVTVSVVLLIIAIVASVGTQYARATRRSTAGSKAYQEVMMGRFFLDKFSPDDAQQAIRYFDIAIKDDPDYAPAYAGLAEAYNQLGSVFIAGKPPSDVRLLALRSAMRAIELDPKLAEAYAVLGYTTMHEMDWTRAEALLRRGIELNPRNMPAHQAYASYLAAQRRFAEAVQEGRRAIELEPASPRAHLILAWMLYFDRQYDAAIQEVRTVLQMDPTSGVAHFRLGQVFIVTGRWDEAIPELRTAVDLTHRAPAPLGLLAMAYGGSGDRDSAQSIVDELERRAATENVPPGATLLAYIGINDTARAIDAAARGYQERDNYAINIAADPLMDPLRNDPRFQALCQQVIRGARLALLDKVVPQTSLARR